MAKGQGILFEYSDCRFLAVDINALCISPWYQTGSRFATMQSLRNTHNGGATTLIANGRTTKPFHLRLGCTSKPNIGQIFGRTPLQKLLCCLILRTKVSSLRRDGLIGISTHFTPADCGRISSNSTWGRAFLCAAGHPSRCYFLCFSCSRRIGGGLFLAGRLAFVVAVAWPGILLSPFVVQYA
jgi:hypothetical protein